MTTKKRDSKLEYNYIGSEKKNSNIIIQKKGQYVTGYSVGILYLDACWYPVIPGNVANLETYDFPVRLKVVPDCHTSNLLSGDLALLESIIKAAKELEDEGARAICAACGFFGNFQDKVATAVAIPVYLSSMIQVPWIKTGLKPGQKIGILTAYAAGLTESLFSSCGITDTSNLIISDLSQEPEFSAILENRGSFDNEKVRQEVVKAAITLVEDNSDIGAILLECSDMPPYAADVQKAVRLPVYDFITMIRWVHHATSQRPYYGVF
ncbi:aspartate/glutamate racemase family protein [Neobacillus mesonae]|uniref:Aspartate/glutamate racemase family protein n=1 Tax=Neobacillus mesonae TaxID=1193713 RepID=A0A3Q9QV01_9BACI|nr:aspartate/glutamate racemase family protein [Neobacillus mesonae]AZU62870.1 aspartate/glutamate racemase family protein [Neobacillus mesonae]